MRKAAIFGVTLSFVLMAVGLSAAFAAEKPEGPAAAISNPAHSAVITGETTSVTVLFDAGPDDKVTAAELYVDGELHDAVAISPAVSSGSCKLTWRCAEFEAGKHALAVRVYDSSGHSRAVDVQVTLQRVASGDRGGLRVEIVSPGEGQEISGLTLVRVSTDESRVRYVMLLIDDVFVALTNMPPFTYSLNTARYLNGPHILRATAFDLADNPNDSPPVNVIINNPGGRTEMRAGAAATPAPEAAAAQALPAEAAAPAAKPSAPAEPAATPASPSPPDAAVAGLEPPMGAPGTPAGPSVSSPRGTVRPAPAAKAVASPEPTPSAAPSPAPALPQPAEGRATAAAASAAEMLSEGPVSSSPAPAAAAERAAMPAHVAQVPPSPESSPALAPAQAAPVRPIAAEPQPRPESSAAALSTAHSSEAAVAGAGAVSEGAIEVSSPPEAAAEHGAEPAQAVRIAAVPAVARAVSTVAAAAATSAPEAAASTAADGAVEVSFPARSAESISAMPQVAALPARTSEPVASLPPAQATSASVQPGDQAAAMAPQLALATPSEPAPAVAAVPRPTAAQPENPQQIARAPSPPAVITAVVRARGAVVLHTVQPGEQLGTISARYDVPVEEIARFNALAAGGEPRAGATLRIPWQSALVLDGAPVYTDVPVMTEGGISLTPFRAIIEHSDGVVHWIPESKQVWAQAFSRDIWLTIGSRIAVVDAARLTLETEARLVRGRAMVPLGLFRDGLGFKVTFDQASGRIYLAAR